MRTWAELFAFSNLAFLALDIYIAHSMNAFRNPVEWLPIFFSLVSPLALAWVFRSRPRSKPDLIAGWLVGGGAVLLGAAGMIFHLQDTFFIERTVKSLVYSAPFVAPLAYVGVGCLVLLNRVEDDDSEAWAQWVLFLALGGFVGNFVLSLCDHAQNGFFLMSEWIPVGAAAVAMSFFSLALVQRDPFFLRACLIVAGLEIAVGVLGALLHLHANIFMHGQSWWERLVFGAPPFAPLLFANLALLAALGIWGKLRLLHKDQAPSL